jgi:hypothetical protein
MSSYAIFQQWEDVLCAMTVSQRKMMHCYSSKVKVKLSLGLTKHHAFLTSSIDGGECSASRLGRFTLATQWIGVSYYFLPLACFQRILQFLFSLFSTYAEDTGICMNARFYLSFQLFDLNYAGQRRDAFDARRSAQGLDTPVWQPEKSCSTCDNHVASENWWSRS